MIQLRDYQQHAIESVRDSFRRGNKSTLLVSPTGSGKCYGRGTPIMLYDGSIKRVEDVAVGDLLMGPDSLPRRVESLARGREEMFRVTPVKGDPFECNRSHILCLDITPSKKGEAPSRTTMSVDDYIKQSAYFKHRAKLWRTGVNFNHTHVNLNFMPAYQMGIWLGDGTDSCPEISCPDQEVLDGWAELAEMHPDKLRLVQLEPDGRVRGLRLSRVNGTGQENIVSRYLRGLGLMDRGKFIPRLYKIASRADRLSLLAGIIDTDGHLCNGYYEVATKYDMLRDDILFVARSLGFAAYSQTAEKFCQTGGGGLYHRVTISGDVSEIPCRVPRKKAQPRRQIKRVTVTGFTVESLGDGDYYGFTLSGPDRLHLLGDFTVGHNTLMFSYIASGVAKNNKRVLIVAHRDYLLRQISDALRKAGVRHSILTAGAVGVPRTPVVVASVFTLVNRLKWFPKPDLIIGDEAHHFSVGSSWGKVVQHYPDSRVLGVTATPERLDGKGLGDLFNDMVLGPSVAELTAQGFLCPADVYAPSSPDLAGVHRRGGDYVSKELEAAMDKPSITGSAVAHYTKLAAGKRAIAFCASVKHAQDVAREFQQAGFPSASIDGKMDKAAQAKVLEDFGAGRVRILTSCEMISEGFDVPATEVAILLRPTASLTLYIQQVGRALRPSPGKFSAIILDHAGNTRRHGFIDDHREWSLAGAGTTRKSSEEAAPQVRSCPVCFSMHKPMPACPKCGHVYEVKSRKVKQVDGELVQLTRSDEAQAAAKEIDIAQRFKILAGVGKKRGYTHPDKWAFNIICGQEAAKLAKSRDPVLQSTVNGLTKSERDRIWSMTMGKGQSQSQSL